MYRVNTCFPLYITQLDKGFGIYAPVQQLHWLPRCNTVNMCMGLIPVEVNAGVHKEILKTIISKISFY